MNEEYKIRKESFFQGCHGTSVLEVFMLVLCLPFTMSSGNALRIWLGQKWVPNRSLRHFLFEMVLTQIPLVGICMGLLPLIPTFWITCLLYLSSVLLPKVLIIVWKQRHHQQGKLVGSEKEGRMPAPHSTLTKGQEMLKSSVKESIGLHSLVQIRKMYISLFRGGLMMYTCLCILAVDFPAFPRRYAKAEGYGGGLMDVGVGGIVLASGLVSKRHECRKVATGGRYVSNIQGGSDRGHASAYTVPRLGLQRMSMSLSILMEGMDRLKRSLRVVLPCAILGGARFVSVKLLGYQEQVGEYGAHWNFFCTIAVVMLLSHMIPLPRRCVHTGSMAVVFICLHQMSLTVLGLGDWALSPHRGSDLISLNKEGLVSCLGYWCLYLVGAAMAQAMHDMAMDINNCTFTHVNAIMEQRECDPLSPVETVSHSSLKWGSMLVGIDVALWSCLLVLEHTLEPRSRRTCNAAYIVWITGLSLCVLLTFSVAQVRCVLLTLQ
ncbi:hypothetical protein CEUSTIGMA_g1185.t1 [Chlamydomonas eustigma]|uniref:GPI-anchored wall transfer protein 1 n=1 Tax=Chlamydomonas eustigma TaxID=1157962 RepID=A0A250WSU9_9CHLO|nr:hypothetical protein CEUSTIGMA_g1185.t1 [Chlamydomonas eustigma]|eukprot:GAX73732.1 hypothetical protein CEUSTIGMA_g1185.t1 [Chlamydomonas eustigma]